MGCSSSVSASVRPTDGSHPSRTAKMYLRMIARKKIGIEIPINDAKRLVWSIQVPYFFAAMNPSGIPKMVAKSIAPTASSTVAGNRSLSSSITGTRVCELVPRSPSAVCFT